MLLPSGPKWSIARAADEVDLIEAVRNRDGQRIGAGAEDAGVDVKDLLLAGLGRHERGAGRRVAHQGEAVRLVARPER